MLPRPTPESLPSQPRCVQLTGKRLRRDAKDLARTTGPSQRTAPATARSRGRAGGASCRCSGRDSWGCAALGAPPRCGPHVVAAAGAVARRVFRSQAAVEPGRGEDAEEQREQPDRESDSVTPDGPATESLQVE